MVRALSWLSGPDDMPTALEQSTSRNRFFNEGRYMHEQGVLDSHDYRSRLLWWFYYQSAARKNASEFCAIATTVCSSTTERMQHRWTPLSSKQVRCETRLGRNMRTKSCRSRCCYPDWRTGDKIAGPFLPPESANNLTDKAFVKER